MSRISLPRVFLGLPLLGASALLAGCVSMYGYSGGEGDYYYADPQVDYYGYGPYGSVAYGGDWYGSVTFRYGAYPYYGGYPYDRYGRHGYPYGGYGYDDPHFHGYRPTYPRPPRHPPHQRPPGNDPPPGTDNRRPIALRGSQPRLPPREVPREQPQVRHSVPQRPVYPMAPVAPVRQAPPPPAPPQPARAERQVRDIGHEP